MIDRAVHRAICGEASLEELISLELFGTKPNSHETVWPAWAQRIWTEATTRYRLRSLPMEFPAADQTRANHREAMSVRDVWQMVMAIAPTPETWWCVPDLTWLQVGAFFNIGERTAEYRMVMVQGWRFTGRGPTRVVTHAPCITCGKSTPIESLREMCCMKCCHA